MSPDRAAADPEASSAQWMTWLTTEHYNLQTQRAATIGEANGRASVFLGALSAGLIALGFATTGHASPGLVTFQVLVLSALALLGIITFLRCVQIAVDDWDYADRIQLVRGIYAELMPGLALRLRPMARQEQSTLMLHSTLNRLQALLTVAGSLGVITSIVIGGDAGVLSYGVHPSIAVAIAVGVGVGALSGFSGLRFQISRWQDAEKARQPVVPQREETRS